MLGEDIPPPPTGRPTKGVAAPKVVPKLTNLISPPPPGMQSPDVTAGRVHLAAFLLLMGVAWYLHE